MKELINVCNTYELKTPTVRQSAELVRWVIPQTAVISGGDVRQRGGVHELDLRKLFFFEEVDRR
jgi:hypothetical protein